MSGLGVAGRKGGGTVGIMLAWMASTGPAMTKGDG